MADPQLVESPAQESEEIKAYVVKPVEPRDYRRQAQPTTSVIDRLKAAFGSQVQVREIYPVAEDAEATSTVRYEARVERRSPLKPIAVGVAAIAAVAVVGAVVAGLKAQRPAPVVAASTIVSAAPEAASGASKAVQAHRTANVDYEVAKGDSFTSVAAKFGLTPRTVRLANNLPLGHQLAKGEKLVIPPSDGANHVIQAGETLGALAQRYGVSEALIRKHNPGIKPKALQVGQKVFIPGATALLYADNKPARGPRKGGAWANRLKTSRSLVGEFGNRVGELLWPAEGKVSSGFGVRDGSDFHPGLDIGVNIGTPVHVAKAGKVLAAGWAGAYGYAVDVDHGGGVMTRYGHCSKVLVKAGQLVEAGDVIAKSGSTGWSTGPHLHFEVRIQGRAVNPATFF